MLTISDYIIADCDGDHNWSAFTTTYTNLDELSTFITRHHQTVQQHQFTTAADPSKLQGKQLATYRLVSIIWRVIIPFHYVWCYQVQLVRGNPT